MTGVLNLVSVGPGFAYLIMPRAKTALRDSIVIVAYDEICEDDTFYLQRDSWDYLRQCMCVFAEIAVIACF